MVNLMTVQAGLRSLQVSMMKGKTIAVAACAVSCMLGAEAVFVPVAMNSSYERYESYVAPSMVSSVDAAKPAVNKGGRYIPLAPVKKRAPVNNRDGDDKSPVS